MARNGWAKYANHMSKVGGLFLGPQGNNSNWTRMFELLVPEEEAELGCCVPNKPTSIEEIAERAKRPVEEVKPMIEHMAQKGFCSRESPKAASISTTCRRSSPDFMSM